MSLKMSAGVAGIATMVDFIWRYSQQRAHQKQ